jgi:histone H3/H4
LVSSEANEVCAKEGKKTIGPKHIIEALKVDPLS